MGWNLNLHQGMAWACRFEQTGSKLIHLDCCNPFEHLDEEVLCWVAKEL